ncbi:agamous-like MADS-box protein AGL80 [Triticum urartu]|uniref:agamous-like MADS-box protein AGL80 n=1 Tax=Triticum dicoccoides TaxID=85692 RepID=UPI00162E63DE|nr:agamous-like MADS-box protein AGL80 [Triticum dicoccoides]XP_037445533.1 agamous-like MADS-box protein AGL80 [Triticum dicoccoides]XP_037449686.1 agamous-like MADS-box protein AGL80 [Triticum dicoccoides]XP_048533347.1 agamous-like MADS-box protein AGL80 [Triticum urartu]XP_048550393.1 agamous-like MADS-box protein AGL80 [Triticum urartu]
MARKKVALRYIRNNSARRNALKKHTKILMKKAGEVAAMPDAKACVVVYGEGMAVPEVFPSHGEAVAILNQFKSMQEAARLKKTMDQESILRERIVQLQEQVQKARREEQDQHTKILLYKALKSGHFPDNIEELTALGSKVDSILKSLSECTTKMSGQPPVDQAQVPYVTNGRGMGPPIMYQAPPQQQEGCLNTMRFERAPTTVIYDGDNTCGYDGNNDVFSRGHMNM